MSGSVISKEERLRLRQQKLARWKAKLETELPGPKSETPEPETENPSPKAENPEPESDRKPLEPTKNSTLIARQKKLEEWKRKKQGISVISEPPLALKQWKSKRSNETSSTKLKLAKLSKPLLSVKRTVNSLFDESTDTQNEKPFKKPNLSSWKYSNKDEDTVDSLDAFVESLKDQLDQTEQTDPNHTNHTNHTSQNSIKPVDVQSDSDNDEPISDENDIISKKMLALNKEKELFKVDHSTQNYLPFNKSFYKEPTSIKQLSSMEIDSLRLSMDAIKVRGSNIPAPIWEWSQLGLSSLILSILEEKLNHTTPTSIQSQALPVIMSGRDFLGIAKTGSGKTLAFILPLLRHIQDQPPLQKGDGPIALLLSPTRELALQIYKVLQSFTKKLGISACCCYGGSSIESQIADLKKGSQVVVATPGRMIDLLAANHGRVCNLKRVTYVVLDEADRMFDFGFEPQVTKIFSQVRPDRQSILFSATFAKKMESLAKSILHDPVEVIVGGISVVAPEIEQKVEFFETSETETDEDIFQRKLNSLVELLEKYSNVKKLVFVEKQSAADTLLVSLLSRQLPCVTIHGGKDQIDRKYAIKEFSSKDSGIDILIATSIAARGLDVKGLDLVVNFDPANHMEDYVHRVGRTGRAGNSGVAYSFVTSTQTRSIADLVKAMKLSHVPEEKIDGRLIAITDQFLGNVKSGKEKYRFGFGGNGLVKLDQVRNLNLALERKSYDIDNDSKPTSLEKQESKLDLPEFKVIEGRAEETSGPDKCKFHSRVTINDLPQKARWTVVNAESLTQIIEATGTSITNKGQFYAANSKVPDGGPPKLYLLIEGLSESAVSEANRLIRIKMIEGLEKAALDDNVTPVGKYSV